MAMERADFMAELFGMAAAQAIGADASDEAVRGNGELILCGEVFRHLRTYEPHPVPDLPHELRTFGALSHEERVAALAESEPRNRAVFGQYRYVVTEVEAMNASRLQVLVSTMHTLMRLRDKAEAATIDGMLEAIHDWIVRVWRVTPPLSATAGELRNWCTKHTRRPDVLPNAWRHL